MVQPITIPTTEAFQALLLETVSQQQHLVASVPWAISPLNLYAFAALSMQGVALAVCLDSDMLRLNMDILQHSGFAAPEVMMLDTVLMPHEERSVLEALNRGRVRLLLTTPESFASLRLLSALARLDLSMILIEDAHHLLPGGWGDTRYRKLAATLRRFKDLPSMVLLTGPLGPIRMVSLAEQLALSPVQLCQFPISLDGLALHVHKPLTRHQQLGQLSDLLAGRSGADGKPSVLPSPVEAGAVIIRVRDPKEAFRISAVLDQLAIEPVWLYPASATGGGSNTLTHPDPRELRHHIRQAKTGVLVDASPPGRFLSLSPEAGQHTIIYWDLPPQLDALLMDGVTTRNDAEIHVFYNRELLDEASRGLLPRKFHNREQPEMVFDPAQQARQALMDMKNWCLTDECRTVTLARLTGLPVPGPCGQCDACTHHPTPARGFMNKVLKHLLYS